MKITDYLAIYGAALSTAVFLWTVGKARRRLTVRMTPGILSGDDDTAGFYAVVHIVNRQSVSIRADHVGILWPYRKVTFWAKLKHVARYRSGWATVGWVHGALPTSTKAELPKVIEAGHSHMVWVRHEELEAALSGDQARRCMACVSDGVGQRFYSNHFTVRPKAAA
ncbi:hypothetical protein [Phenylobacterium sp.]|uniref:hypothetical protein n=1 Tax=Phenylobacterium sp. TaxID=1871053 RepID=UPI0027347AB4|nr:hypothetical protein [Phenylobacterium sp.]MDP3634110.1 hypothetical protein [Phenylobacterium sp.]